MHLYELPLPAWLRWGYEEGLQGFGSLLLSLNHLIPLLPSQAQLRASEPVQHQSQNSSSWPHAGGEGGPLQQPGHLPQRRAKTFLRVMGGWQCPLQKPPPGLFSVCLCFPIQEKASVTTAADSFSDLVPSVPDITFVCCQSGKNNDLPAHFSSVDYVVGGDRSFN